MSIAIIKERLESYSCMSDIEEVQALREITQELILAALGRTAFFRQAAFQGGTCLRILYGLNRFSEDLDFVLKESDPGFEWKPHLKAIVEELSAYGYQIEFTERTDTSAVRKAFIKDDTIGKILNLHFAGKSSLMRKIRINLEIDCNPPSGSEYEIRYLDFPFVSSVVVQNLPTLFSGKIHALLCREYVKGRDWYDFLWYTARRTTINHAYLASALKQIGPWQGQGILIDSDWCIEELRKRIDMLDWAAVAEDVRRFVHVREQPSIDLWSRDLFLFQLAKIPQ